MAVLGSSPSVQTSPYPVSAYSPVDSVSYTYLKQEISEQKERFKHTYTSGNLGHKQEILQEARSYLQTVFRQLLFPTWEGTPWSFSGMTRTPRQGTIACGYFVTTLLQDAGSNINRIKLAQAPSEVMMKKLIEEPFHRFSYAPLENIVESLEQNGEGIYVVGLDCHTGFINYENRNICFVHSSYEHPFSVCSEDLGQSHPFYSSHYVVFAKLFSDAFMKKWILGEPQ